jgi:uridine phosphorylase
MFKVNPSDVEKAAKSQGMTHSELRVPSSIILTFNRAIIEELVRLCHNLKDWEWKGERFSPYSSSQRSLKGSIDNSFDIAVFMPPMGASPLTAFSEELIYFGAKFIILVCASWGLGEDYLLKGQIHLPNFAIGIDGTSIHYGNKNWRIMNEPRAFNALSNALDRVGANWKTGGVGACEAIYRITPKLMNEFREKGCLSMENGEVASLYSLTQTYKIAIGVLLQSYLDLEEGWNVEYMDEKYIESCKMQVQAAIEAFKILQQNE